VISPATRVQPNSPWKTQMPPKSPN